MHLMVSICIKKFLCIFIEMVINWKYIDIVSCFYKSVFNVLKNNRLKMNDQYIMEMKKLSNVNCIYRIKYAKPTLMLTIKQNLE